MKIGSLVQCISNDPEVLGWLIHDFSGFDKTAIYTISELVEGIETTSGKTGIGIHFYEIKANHPNIYANIKFFAELQSPDEVNVQEIVNNAILQPA